MRLRLPVFVIFVAIMAMLAIGEQAFAFDLWQDVQQQTQWTLGSSVEAGTAVALRSDASTNVKGGQFIGSALASIANYRFLNVSAGGNFIPQPNGTLRALDTGKLGINLAYIFKGFVNQPPAMLTNLVIGPSLSTSLVSTPHVVIPFFDINYSFGGATK
jgi:hypothetical protein